ncbi:MAG: hypothetical protein V8S08_02930 [Lachnoclostridium sp.]
MGTDHVYKEGEDLPVSPEGQADPGEEEKFNLVIHRGGQRFCQREEYYLKKEKKEEKNHGKKQQQLYFAQQ